MTVDLEKKATEQTAAQRALAAEDDAAVSIFQEGCRAYVDVMKRRGIPSLQIGYWETSYPWFGKPKRSWIRLDVGWTALCGPLDPQDNRFRWFGRMAVLDGGRAILADPEEMGGVSVLVLPMQETQGSWRILPGGGPALSLPYRSERFSYRRWRPYEDDYIRNLRRWRTDSEAAGRNGLWDGVRTHLDVWAILVEENFASALIHLDR
jgi:hypothetical protein